MRPSKRPKSLNMAVAEPQSPISKIGGARKLLNVPMIKEDELIGVIGIYRQELRLATGRSRRAAIPAGKAPPADWTSSPLNSLEQVSIKGTQGACF